MPLKTLIIPLEGTPVEEEKAKGRKMEGTIVLYPVMALGHLVSMVEFGKLILRHHHHRFSVTIVIAEGPLDTPDDTAFLRHISETTNSITFHHLPYISMKPSSNLNRSSIRSEFIHLNNPNLSHALQTISKISSVRAFVIDMFCTPALSVASDLGISTYYFFTSGAVALSFFLYLPTIHNQTTKSFKDISTTHVHFPGVPPMPASDLPERVQDREEQNYHDFLEIGLNLRRSKGIMVNTFKCLESRSIKAINDGLCVPDAPTPPVYCVGPLIAAPKNEGEAVSHCMSWLDGQPSQSVVFLSFGSRGVFSTAQVREIAIGLEKSGQRFLWVVRKPVSEDNSKHFTVENKDPDLEALLPEGFLERNKERGLVVKSWAPQVEVVGHESVGGFVTHCGWNSILEAVSSGVPMVAWPLYAEQRMNKVFLVEGMKLAMPMEESEDGLVSAAEVEKRVTDLMESEEGRVLRERSRKMKEEAMAVWSDSGSSMTAFTKLVDSLINQALKRLVKLHYNRCLLRVSMTAVKVG
ncbi:UDP-glycosyltransferase 88F4-like [Macadamia integrifolia]|uniref:UDP-glycosyltransferase 88F4-like n=1 Tax=Macadamia integrifolia TaxID=60698 RepID=UPI001C4E34EB|nr:UDP-glycosyltransferase 88F4-like [Macadamia integrifolia]